MYLHIYIPGAGVTEIVDFLCILPAAPIAITISFDENVVSRNQLKSIRFG